jgi:hypothetical protein
MSEGSTHQSSKVSEHPHRVVLSLSLQGSVLVVVLALLLWAILTFGSNFIAAESRPLATLTAVAHPEIACSEPQASEKGVLPADGGEGADSYHRCFAKEWPHTTTSRQPGGGAGERAH